MALYVMPLTQQALDVGTEAERTAWQPAYAAPGSHLDGWSWSQMPYAMEGWCLVRADLDATTRAGLVAEPDVWAIPENLDQAVGGAAATVAAKMEAAGMPGDWVAAATTWRQLVRRIGAYCQLLQRARGRWPNKAGRLFSARTLDSTFGDLPVAMRQALMDAADDFGFDRVGIGLGTTLRVALKQIAHQWTVDLRLGGEVL